MRRTTAAFVAIVALMTILPAAQAHWPHAVGRYLGVGWSDGYHSHWACPPKRHQQPVMQEIPWWMVPESQPEPLPYPAANRPTN